MQSLHFVHFLKLLNNSTFMFQVLRSLTKNYITFSLFFFSSQIYKFLGGLPPSMKLSLYNGVCELYIPNQGQGITTRKPIGWHNTRVFPSPLQMSQCGAIWFGSNRLKIFANKPNWTSQTNNYERCHCTSMGVKLQGVCLVLSTTL